MKSSFLSLVLLIASSQAVEWTSFRPIVPRNMRGLKRLDISSRVTEGSEASPGQFPYQIALILDGVGVCGASLISETIVLSAGHCLDGFITIEVNIGAHNLYDFEEPGRINLVSRDFRAHEDYDLFTLVGDIGYVRLPEPVTLSPKIQTIRLPSLSQTGETFAGAKSIVSGWGVYNSSLGVVSPVLKYAEMSVMSNEECDVFFPEGFILDEMICTIEITGNACNSDSGGPVVVTEDDGIPTLIGIVSFGPTQICEDPEPTGHSRVSSHLQWIETNTGVPIRP